MGDYTQFELREYFTAAWLAGLEDKARQEAERRPAQSVRLDGTDRAPLVPLRPTGGDRG